ncbi:hypothetical protein ARMSODRAFT_900294 [Armillaria solidipes]|uniref:DNA helicase n=1 Tax=Armillaria solidipes TaxID=1076256 RepID=A0A2H3B423_9AGAR|nr:hypothetical protein ARMSODRAFT_900294 [Armillaria solidipes]
MSNLEGSLSDSDFLNSLIEPGVPVHVITLKVRAICRLTCNFDALQGLTKNTCVIVCHMFHYTVEVETIPAVIARKEIGSEFITLSRIDCHFQPQNINIIVYQKQLSLAFAYAVTFNVCQGLTVLRLALDLHWLVFSHRQLYLAVTQVPNASDIIILKVEGDVSTLTTNVVWDELLL